MEEFYTVLRQYQKLLAWAVAVAATPFAMSLASLAPPWPAQIAPITAIAQLAVLILIYQLFRRSSRRTVNRIISLSFIALFLTSFLYLTLLLSFTYQLDGSTARFARGFICTPIAKARYSDLCPFLGGDQLNGVEYVATRLWTETSISMVHLTLIASWTLAFMTLAALVGMFVVYQQKTPRKIDLT